MPWIGKDLNSHIGKVVGNGQCVRFLQIVAGVPHTSQWRCGRKVRGSDEIETGTPIACFDPSGRYGNHIDGRSHAALFLEERPEGLLVIDQWVGHPVAQRIIQFRGGQGKRVNDGDAFHIIEAEE